MKQVTVSDKGQVALPVSILRQTGIRPGDRLNVSQTGARIVLVKLKHNRGSARDKFWAVMRTLCRITRGARRDLEAELLEHRRRETRKKAGRL